MHPWSYFDNEDIKRNLRTSPILQCTNHCCGSYAFDLKWLLEKTCKCHVFYPPWQPVISTVVSKQHVIWIYEKFSFQQYTTCWYRLSISVTLTTRIFCEIQIFQVIWRLLYTDLSVFNKTDILIFCMAVPVFNRQELAALELAQSHVLIYYHFHFPSQSRTVHKILADIS